MTRAGLRAAAAGLLALTAGAAWAQAPRAAPAPAANGAPKPLVFLIATNHAAPLVLVQDGQLRGGILAELGETLAAELQRPAAFLLLPARRAPDALTDGRGDLLCYALPEWISVPAHWSQPVLPNALVVASTAEAAVARGLPDLADVPVGTVLGYRYADVEKALGTAFRRDDAPDMASNLRKLAAGRVPYAITEALVVDAYRRNHPQPALRVQFAIERFTASCALALNSTLELRTLNNALTALKQDGRLERILARHR
jgi:polar amino acid transport system substrate-binding protein